MARPPQPLFLARARYRQRRLRDAMRLLPILGAVLFALPTLWPQADGAGVGGGEAGPATSNAMALVYIFGVWSVLIALGFIFARRMRPEEDDRGGDALDLAQTADPRGR